MLIDVTFPGGRRVDAHLAGHMFAPPRFEVQTEILESVREPAS